MADSHHGSSASSRLRGVSSHSMDRSAADHRDSYYSRERDKHRDGDRHRSRERSRDEREASSRASLHTSERAVLSSGRYRPPERKEEEKSRVSTSSSDDSPNSGSADHGGLDGKDAEKEPGELSGGSLPDDYVVADVGKTSKRSKSVHEASTAYTDGSPTQKKRKFVPIVWDLDDRDEHKGSDITGGSMSVLKITSSTKMQSRSSPNVSSSPLPSASASTLPSSTLLPPQQSQSQPKNRSPYYRTPPASGTRETPPKSSSRQSSTPSSAAHNPSIIRALSSSAPKSGIISTGSKKTAMSRTSYRSPSASPEIVSPQAGGVEYSAPTSQLDPRVNSNLKRSSISPGGSSEGQLSGSPTLQEDDAYAAAPPRDIAASRWAEDNTPPSESKPPGGKARYHQSLSMESDEAGQLSTDEEGGREITSPSGSPEPGEYIKEEPEMLTEGTVSSDGLKTNEDDQYERDLNKRELMDLDKGTDESSEEEHPEVDSDEEVEVPVQQVPPLVRTIDMLQGCRSVDEFEKLNKIDEGTYGVVYRARDKKTGEIVALKKVKMEKEREGFPMTSLREINVLLSIHHPCIVDVKEVVVGSNLDSIFMVMEYMEHDLKGLMETIKQPFSQSEVKCLMLQLFEGVKHLHDNWVLHRDLKTSNLLLNNRGELKICDFGLARQYGSPLKTYTHMVVTLWYRAPELLLGCKQYSTAVDMWSLGCIMAEFLAKEPLFNGKNELDQLDKIFKVLGTPNETIWPDFVKLPNVKCNFVKQPFNKLREKFPPTAFAGRPPLSEKGFNLLNRLLLYDPKKRITAEEALQHDWFKEVPLPKMKELMPTYPARSEHERRSRRLQKSPDPLAELRRRELRQAELGAGGLFG
ncbi:hypothetical protein KP509_32G016400 [Ceratopteris richardii]|uniref:cyclin-dependent kinase n=1 Tax=Ceratopteris richardii TaxID=49495 RepID=A0A8T2QST8_CERRI|nr:hypothetical protein KP509_32G016400 [Ceratopteris richardii]KAH7286651.1 hypothetical protein KP509_32G016400 [Ceratopteris richardii]KAH7286652.1 hypothetical protein KP509_32G016400 [Ceratopteris richardii]KAH7286653.1 hypothetical protein KP509_32G016400 [Ceratopteris richardii]KAH7286654.1 hypothetical protein KP509_32G016400 [Ceratopteris richardii]